MLSIEEIKNIVCPLAKKYEVDRVYLFGSYARGEATEKSDVDLCIDPGKLDGLEFCGFYVDLEEQLNCGIDLLTRRQLKICNYGQLENYPNILYLEERSLRGSFATVAISTA